MNSLVYLIETAYNIFMFVLFIRALISWIAPNFHNSGWRNLLRLLYQITEPVLSPIRRLLPANSWGIDFSPIIAIIILFFLQQFLVGFLVSLSRDFGFINI